MCCQNFIAPFQHLSTQYNPFPIPSFCTFCVIFVNERMSSILADIICVCSNRIKQGNKALLQGGRAKSRMKTNIRASPCMMVQARYMHLSLNLLKSTFKHIGFLNIRKLYVANCGLSKRFNMHGHSSAFHAVYLRKMPCYPIFYFIKPFIVARQTVRPKI